MRWFIIQTRKGCCTQTRAELAAWAGAAWEFVCGRLPDLLASAHTPSVPPQGLFPVSALNVT